MGKLVTAVQAKHQKNFEAMTPELQKVATTFTSKAKAMAKGAILIAYDMGVKLKTVIAEEASYGANAVEQLAAHLGATWSATKLYSYRDFSVQFPKREDVEKLVEATMSDGGRVSVSHCLAIGKVKDVKVRRKLWKKVFDEGMSSESLKAEIQAKYETRNTEHSQPNSGRKPARPTSIMGGAQEMAKMATRFNKKFEGWNEAVIEEVLAKPAEEMTDALIQKLHEAEAALETTENQLMTYRPKLQKALDRAEKLQEKNKAAATKEKAAQTKAATGSAKKKSSGKKAAKKAPAKKKTSKAKKKAAAK